MPDTLRALAMRLQEALDADEVSTLDPELRFESAATSAARSALREHLDQPEREPKFQTFAPCPACGASGVALAAPRAGEREPSAEAVEELLKLHRRFHGKVGCPGGEDCYVCAAEDAIDHPRVSEGPTE